MIFMNSDTIFFLFEVIDDPAVKYHFEFKHHKGAVTYW